MNSRSSRGHPNENNIQSIGIMETDDYDYISKFAGTDCKSNKEVDVLEEDKNEHDFHFLLLSPKSIHKTIFDIKAQTKNIKTADFLKLPIVQKIMNTEKR